jgi:hypothetical protein
MNRALTNLQLWVCHNKRDPIPNMALAGIQMQNVRLRMKWFSVNSMTASFMFGRVLLRHKDSDGIVKVNGYRHHASAKQFTRLTRLWSR